MVGLVMGGRYKCSQALWRERGAAYSGHPQRWVFHRRNSQRPRPRLAAYPLVLLVLAPPRAAGP